MFNRPVLKTYLPWALSCAFILRELLSILGAHSFVGNHDAGAMAKSVCTPVTSAAADQVGGVAAAASDSEPFAWSEAEAREKLITILNKGNARLYEQLLLIRSFPCDLELTSDESELVQSRLATFAKPPTLSLCLCNSDDSRIDDVTTRAAVADALGEHRAEQIFATCAHGEEVQQERRSRLWSVVLQDELGLVEEQRRRIEQILIERGELEAKASKIGGDAWGKVVAQEARDIEDIRTMLTAPQFERYLAILKDYRGSDLDPLYLPQPPEPADEEESLESAGKEESAK